MAPKNNMIKLSTQLTKNNAKILVPTVVKALGGKRKFIKYILGTLAVAAVIKTKTKPASERKINWRNSKQMGNARQKVRMGKVKLD